MAIVTNEGHRLASSLEARWTQILELNTWKNIVFSSLILAKNIECLFDKYGIWNNILR